MPKFEVTVHRRWHQMISYEIEASDRYEAETIALEEAAFDPDLNAMQLEQCDDGDEVVDVEEIEEIEEDEE